MVDNNLAKKTFTDLNINSITVSGIEDKLTLSGDAAIIIRVEDCDGNVTTELKTDSQKLTGDSLFWRFSSVSDREGVGGGSGVHAFLIKDICREDMSGAVVSFHLATVQDGQSDIQAMYHLSHSEVRRLLCCVAEGESKEGVGDNNDTRAMELKGKMCRNDIVDVCTITVATEVCGEYHNC